MNSRKRSLLVGAGAGLATLLVSLTAAAQDVTYTVGASPLRPATGELWTFYVLGGLTVLGALATVTRRNPVTAAICLVGTLVASAGLYVMLHATFLAAIQVLVYAGAIMVLFVLVVMSVEHPEHEELGLWRGTLPKLLGVGAMGWMLYRVVKVVAGPEVRLAGPVPDDFGSVRSVGKLLFSDYLFPFEAISVLLLVAIVGAVVVSRSRAQREEEPATPGGARGGTAKPASPSGRRA